MREKLIEILRVPIYPHELVDPTEAVADYLLDNDVVPVVRCKHCVSYGIYESTGNGYCMHRNGLIDPRPYDFCSYGERKTNERKAD